MSEERMVPKYETPPVNTQYKYDIPIFKYNETALLEELRHYLAATYGAHYAADDKYQSFDGIVASGHGTGFCIGSILKYAGRYGRKEGHNRKDLLKIIHYAMLEMYLQDKEGKK